MHFGSSLIKAVISVFTLFTVTTAFGRIPPSPVTGLAMADQSPSGRVCMSKHVPKNQVASLLSQKGTNIDGPRSESFEQGTATAFQRIADLGRPDLVSGIKVKTFPDGRPGKSGCASYAAGQNEIHITGGNGGRCHRGMDTTGLAMHITHEMGHTVGLKLGLYGNFPKCNVTGYCTHNNSQRNSEAFAESFAMYVHSPATLQKACPEAYNYIKQNVFKGRESNAGICRGVPATAIAGGTTGESPATFAGSTASTERGYNGGGGTQIAGLMQGLLPIATAMMQKQQEPEPQIQAQPGTIVIPKRAPATPAPQSGMPTVR